MYAGHEAMIHIEMCNAVKLATCAKCVANLRVSRGNWKTRKRGNGNNLKDVENVSQSRGHTLVKSLR